MIRTDHLGKRAAAADILRSGARFARSVLENNPTMDPEVRKELERMLEQRGQHGRDPYAD
jgi:hypothetical protein